MKYLLYSSLFIFLYFYLGMGVTILFTPKNLKRYALLLSPLVGYCYLTLIGWYCYILNLSGTDTYGLIIIFPPIIFLYLGLKKAKAKVFESKRLFYTEFIAPLIVGIFCFSLISLPFYTNLNGLTSIAIGNNDIASYASNATYLKEFPRSSTVGALEQLGFKSTVEPVFGAFLSTAFPSSLFSLETYQIQNLSISVFFLFSILLVFVLARKLFGYDPYPAIAAAVLYGLNPIMYYTVYQGFQSQVIATGLALCVFLLYFHALNDCKAVSDYYSYLPLAILFNWGISLTYPHMLIFIYAPLVAYLLLISIHNRSISLALRWASFVMVVFLVSFVLSPHRGRLLVSYLFLMAKVDAGWYMPWFSPDIVFGIPLNEIYLHSGFERTVVSIPLVFFIILGFFNIHKTEWRPILFAGSSLSVILVGYTLLSYMGKAEVGWGGYKSYKFLSFFLPLMILSSLNLFSKIQLTSINRMSYLLTFILTILIGLNVLSAYKNSSAVKKNHREVSRDVADLKKIQKDPLVTSINILETDWWDIMWEANFLMRKKLYFKTPTYYSASNLDGEWDLVRCPSGSMNQLATLPDNVIPVNSSYRLTKHSHFAKGGILPDDAFTSELSILNGNAMFIMNMEATTNLPIKIKNISNTTWVGGCSLDTKHPINIAYHWLDVSGRIIIYDGQRTALPHDLKPGEEIVLNVTVLAPNKPGEYLLEFDMVQEQVAWFKDKGSHTALTSARIE